ncbi:MAG: hypothetical protein Q8J98_03965 [Phaeovulum sp.]|nr:hypothetical protein [Phaeovulum sp.]
MDDEISRVDKALETVESKPSEAQTDTLFPGVSLRREIFRALATAVNRRAHDMEALERISTRYAVIRPAIRK